MKVLHREIESCKECPFHHLLISKTDDKEWDVCIEAKCQELSDPYWKPPTWCPLPDKEDKMNKTNKVLDLKALVKKTGISKEDCLKVLMVILEEADIVPFDDKEATDEKE